MLKKYYKAYAWDGNGVMVSPLSGEEIIGLIMDFKQDVIGGSQVLIRSLLDKDEYWIAQDKVFIVGTGPIMKKKEVVYEDYYV